ncbi:MAG: glycosyltransferase family 2 protein [Candidatus Tectomicrobia bacterium]|uniref:Glycosyltransferase family 2 protein n=1 Tax=Tectimicrobiota bacterium TaxID=2528274 RepID=A0A932I128_UNCTE|nr:glycosyltransferase family 2 protein [Candidatus Tectomicrobia bacterium]
MAVSGVAERPVGAEAGAGAAPGRAALSVAIVTRDEAARVIPCLESAAWADEIVVVDSGSSDGTQELCRARGAVVLERPWGGYAAQKNLALGEARHPWVLSLDADERVTEELKAQILQVLAADGPCDGYRMPRKNIFFGKWLRRGDFWPDHQIRLFRKARGRFSDKAVHESVEVEGRVGELTAPLEHRSYERLEEYFARQVRYAALAAEERSGQAGAVRLRDLLLRPAGRFAKGYVLKGGWRDGIEGFIAAAGGAFYVFMRTAFLWERRRGTRG